MKRARWTGCGGLAGRGFSLVELVVVLAILGVIAGIAVPRFADAANGQRAEMAALRLSTDLAMVREMARAQSRSVTVTFDAADVSYAIKGDGTSVVPLGRDPYGLSGLEASFGDGGAAELTVDGFGRWTASGTAKVYAGSRVVTVRVDGGAVESDPAEPAAPAAASPAAEAAAAAAEFLGDLVKGLLS